MRRPLVFVLALMLSATGAWADRYKDCNQSADRERRIRGCTEINNEMRESVKKRAEAYNNRGIAYADKGEFDRAIADYAKAIKLDLDYVLAYYNRGFTYQTLGQRDKAIADYRKALEIDSSHMDAKANLEKLLRTSSPSLSATTDAKTSPSGKKQRSNAASEKIDIEFWNSIEDSSDAAMLQVHFDQAFASLSEKIDIEFWNGVKDSNDAAMPQAYLDLFPDGAFVSLARIKIGKATKTSDDSTSGERRIDEALGATERAVTEKAQAKAEKAKTEATLAATSKSTGDPQSAFIKPAGDPQLVEQQLATDMQAALKNVGCYTKGIDGDWGSGSRTALQRFNTMAGTNFATDVASQEALAAVTSWSGGKCKAVAKRRTPRKTRKARTYRKKKPPSGGDLTGTYFNLGSIGIGF